jgi:hypothetical protein
MMSKVYHLEMDAHQLKLVVDALSSLVRFQMDVAQTEHDHAEVVHLVHDCLAVKRIINQIEIQYGTTTKESGRTNALHEEEA